jgi:hypothetical protein
VDVFRGLGEKFPVRDGLVNRGIERAHRGFNTTPRAKLSIRGLRNETLNGAWVLKKTLRASRVLSLPSADFI